MKKLFLLILALLTAVPVFAYTGTTIGPNVSQLDGKELQWEAGSFDYFVMFKSLMSNENRNQCSVDGSVGCDLPGNPEPDTCLTQSTFQLTNRHVPEDAYVEAAYLVWSVSVDPNNIHTDNTATLNFTSEDGKINETIDVAASRAGMLGTDANPGQQDFTFEGIAYESSGQIVGGHYTYRVDITDFFNKIHAEGRDLGYKSDGLSLYGNYTVSGIDCTNDPSYISKVDGYTTYSSTVMAGWSIITVYRSTKVSAKMVYIYNGFSQYSGQYVDLGISGFEFPDKPIVKMTFAVHEGDPGFAYATGCGGLLGGGACPPEGLQVTGQTTPAESTVIVQNDCNPPKFQDSDGTAFNYSETYNSISSIYGWQDSVPTCAGGDPNNPNPDTLEYTMDVDTFLLDAETNPLYDEQFKKGDTNMFIRIGANRDVIYTNYMVVSVDTKAPRYDIPVNPVTPDGREKNFCSCSEQADSICSTAPFYFMIKIQNWGDDISTNVTVQDTLAVNKISYVPGTTEMCKEWKSDNVCKKWIPIEDVNGAFPLANPYKVADTLYYCDQATQVCDETVMVRFKVMPKENLAKNEVIENTAIISDDSGKPYKTNTSIPLRLTLGNCPSPAACENPDLTPCGGYGDGGGCEKDEECGTGKVCKDGACVFDEASFASSVNVTMAEGKNSPVSDSAIIIPAPTDNLVMGQFSVIASTEDKDKNFTFDSVTTSVYIKDPETKLNNIRLVYDKNGNGHLDEGENVVAESTINSKTATFALKAEYANYPVNELHHFIIVSDATYKTPETVPVNTSFYFYVESAENFKFSNVKNITTNMDKQPLQFAEFSFEPTTEAFVFTKGGTEPAIPSISKINKEPVAVLQIRAKSIANSNSIKKFTVKTTSKSVKFKDGIKKLSLYLDTDKNASYESEQMIASIVPEETTGSIEFVLDTPLSFEAGEEKTLLLVAEFNIPKDQTAQIEITKSKFKLANDMEVIGLPIKSKEFSYKCEEGDYTCLDGDDDGGSCAVTAVDDENTGVFALVIAALPFVLGFAFTRKSDAK